MRNKPEAKRNDQKITTDPLKHPKLNKNSDPNLQGRVTGGLFKYYTYTYLVGEEKGVYFDLLTYGYSVIKL